MFGNTNTGRHCLSLPSSNFFILPLYQKTIDAKPFKSNGHERSTHVHTDDFALVCGKTHFESDENTMFTIAKYYCNISTGNIDRSYLGRQVALYLQWSLA